MNRRSFILQSTLATLALQFESFKHPFGHQQMGLVVHSYNFRTNPKTESLKYPVFKDALDLIRHCQLIGAGGVQTIVNNWTSEFSKSVREKTDKANMYFEASIALPKSNAELIKFEQNIVQAKNAGAQVVRTVTLGPRRYETFKDLNSFLEFKAQAIAILKLVEPVLQKHKVKLAIENHKDFRAQELADLLKSLNSEWMGVTLDFGNNIALLEDPMHVVEVLAPYAFSTHIKDMAVDDYSGGFLLSEIPLGKGILDLSSMIAICKKHNPNINFNLEMITRDPLEINCFDGGYWVTFENISGKELAHTMHMVKNRAANGQLPKINQLSLEEKLAKEEENNLECFKYSREVLGL